MTKVTKQRRINKQEVTNTHDRFQELCLEFVSKQDEQEVLENLTSKRYSKGQDDFYSHGRY